MTNMVPPWAYILILYEIGLRRAFNLHLQTLFSYIHALYLFLLSPACPTLLLTHLLLIYTALPESAQD